MMPAAALPRETPLSIYTGPVFDMARTQFDVIADYIDIPADERAAAALPEARRDGVRARSTCDDGRIAVFQGYRVQHHLTLGPTKGGTRFAASVDMGEVGGAGDLDELEVRAGRAALWRRQGRRHRATRAPARRRELEALSRRYMQEMIPFVGPQTDVMAPDMGTNEQVMAWFMDTYSMHQGHAVTEIVTGKPVASGGTVGRREATGRGVAHLAMRACRRGGVRRWAPPPSCRASATSAASPRTRWRRAA